MQLNVNQIVADIKFFTPQVQFDNIFVTKITKECSCCYVSAVIVFHA